MASMFDSSDKSFQIFYYLRKKHQYFFKHNNDKMNFKQS